MAQVDCTFWTYNTKTTCWVIAMQRSSENISVLCSIRFYEPLLMETISVSDWQNDQVCDIKLLLPLQEVLRSVVFVGSLMCVCVCLFVCGFVNMFCGRISRKRLAIEARFQCTTNKKWHMRRIEWSRNRWCRVTLLPALRLLIAGLVEFAPYERRALFLVDIIAIFRPPVTVVREVL